MNENVDEIKNEVLKFIQQREQIENEIKSLTAILTQNGVQMNDPLVDTEGFPLNNIDIYQVRHARHRIICLQNDYKDIMKKIESGLNNYYGTSVNECIVTAAYKDNNISANSATHLNKPFARIAFIEPGSPTEYCGFEVNDLIIEFGSINSENFKELIDLALVSQRSENQELNIRILRGNRNFVKQLVPKKWNGRGLLGCNIVPVNWSNVKV